MHGTAFVVALRLLVLLAVVAAPALAQVAITEKPEPDPARGHKVPWVKPGDTTWRLGNHLFDIGDGAEDSSASGWGAVSDRGIHLLVIVRDESHGNSQSGGDIWNGDALQIGIDGRGDGSHGMDPSTRATFGPDDMAISVALTDDGAVGYVHFSGNSDLQRSAMPDGTVAVVRNEDAKLTTYDVTVPWEMMDTPAGLYATVGVAVQVNDNDAGQREQERIYFGRGADGHPGPGMFEKLIPGNPPGNRLAALPGNGTLWDADDRALIDLVVASDGPQVITATMGGTVTELPVPGDGRVRRYAVTGRPDADEAAGEMALAVSVGPTGGEPALTESVGLVVPEAVYESLVERYAALAAKEEHPLMKRHLKSVEALVRKEWARLQLYRPDDPLEAADTLARIQRMHVGLDIDAGDFETYLAGKRELVVAYLSRRDGTLQYYHLGLPKDWDPDKAYPLFLELHGAGNENPLNGVAAHTGGAESETPDLAGYTAPITYAGHQRNGYHVMPFGRGNTGYRDIGETDVWEALADFDRNFKTDPDRRYLYGFSMGGGGTWRLATRTPDRWAAIAVFAGAARGGDMAAVLARNVTYVPTWLWAGEKDRFFVTVSRMRDYIVDAGGRPAFSSTPDLGHNYLGEKQEEAINWLQRHVRKRPTEFEFYADTDDHLGVWGITMRRDPAMSGLPSFKCSIEGNTVRLDTKGTPAVRLELGEGGLGLQGEVTVVLNGKQAYKGPAETVDLDVAAD